MKDKVLIKDFIEMYQAKVCQLHLEHQGIPSWLINKTDSSQMIISGFIELYVNSEDLDKAVEILERFEEEEKEEDEQTL